MYFVDRDKIEETLVYLEERLRLFSAHQSWNTPLEKAALERLTQMMIDSILDVGNAMIDGFIMRDPGSYEDIIEILTDEKVINADMGKSLKHLISYRKVLVQDYTNINHEELFEQFTKHSSEIGLFAVNVRDYIANELGPVSAFKN
jgi:uncharacterized protein YutE (UPF0331/DUF86 family)